MILFRTFVYFVIIGICASNQAQAQAESQDIKEIKIGVLAFRGVQECENRWFQTAKYLTDHIPGYKFRIIPMTHGFFSQAIERNLVDFILTNTGHYIQLQVQFGISRLVTLRTSGSSLTGNKYGAVIFVRRDRKDIQNLSDLRGKRLMAVSQKGFGGFQMAWQRFKEKGINPFKDLSGLTYSGFSQDKIAFAVRDGLVDAGTFRTGSLEILARERKINLKDFRVLEPIKIPHYKYQRSTRLYPEWPFAKHQDTSAVLAQTVAVTLMQMDKYSPAAIAGRYTGWTVPLDYQSAHQLLKELGVPPYKRSPKVTFMLIWERYQIWITVFITTLCLSLLWSLWARRLVAYRTKELRVTNTNLQQQITVRQQLEKQVSERQRELSHIARQNSLGEMASSLAHELNHPLATIINYVNGCTRRLGANTCTYQDIQTVLGMVLKQAQHSANVIKVMKDFVSASPREKECVDINQLISRIMSLIIFEIENKNIDLKLYTELDQLPVFVDRVQIEQVILNLVRNAIEAVLNVHSSMGHIIIETSVDDLGNAKIKINDNGGGIPENIQLTVFDPFISKKHDGLGLGLSICRSIIEIHKGKITIEKTSAEGTTILFMLPMVKP